MLFIKNAFIATSLAVKSSTCTSFKGGVFVFFILEVSTESPTAIKLLTSNLQNGVLLINKGTLDLLEQNYPKGKPAHESVILRDIPEEIQSVHFEGLSSESISKDAVKTKGR